MYWVNKIGMHYMFPLRVVNVQIECAFAQIHKGGLSEGLLECGCVCCVNKLHSHISAKKIYAPVVAARFFSFIIDWKSFSRCDCYDGSVADEGASSTLRIYTLGVYTLHRIMFLWYPTIDIFLLLISVVQKCFLTITNIVFVRMSQENDNRTV